MTLQFLYQIKKMGRLVRYLKVFSNLCIGIFIFTLALSNAYSFGDERVDLAVTNFLDSLTYNYKGFDIKLTEVSLRETYDDNIAFSKEDKLEDFITYAGFGLGMNYEGKIRTFKLTGEITDQIFAKQPSQNNITQYLNLNFTNEFSKRDRISLSNSFSHFEAPSSSDTGYFSAQFGRTAGRFEYFHNMFDLTYSNDVSKQITCFVKYANEVNAFPGASTDDSFLGASRQDSLLNKLGVGMSYAFSPTDTIFSFSYDFTNIAFENDIDATIHTIGPGVRQFITKKLIFDGGAGVDLINSYDDQNMTKLYVQSMLTYIIEEKTQAMLSFRKKYSTNPYYVNIFNSWFVSASLTRKILKRLDGSLSAFYGDGKNIPTNFEGENVSSNLEQEFFGMSASFSYQISKHLKGGFAYTYSQLDSNVENSGYSKNTVILGLSAKF